MLQALLNELKSGKGPMDLNTISRKLKADPSAVEGMLHMLVQMGLLEDSGESSDCQDGKACVSCGSSKSCPFSSGQLPRTFRIKN